MEMCEGKGEGISGADSVLESSDYIGMGRGIFVTKVNGKRGGRGQCTEEQCC